MAGIGFELKKLFSKEGILAKTRAYGYAGIVCTGPMLLGVILLLGVRFIAQLGGAFRHDQELLVCMLTYALLASLIFSSMLSMITTRFVADMLYSDKREEILPSFYGSCAVILAIGCTCYGIFLCFSGVKLIYTLLSFLLFSELCVVWTEINYMTALKDYKSILLTFVIGLLMSFGSGFVFIWINIEPITAMMLAVCVGYGIMMIWFCKMMHQYFPRGKGSTLQFLAWIDRYPKLVWVGLLTTLGLFAHIVIVWMGPMGVQVEGLFYGAPEYDVPALFAFLSILYTTINFVTSVEVNFYVKYRQYFSLFNDGGSIKDIEEAEMEMTTVLKQELYYLALKQFFMTVVFIIVVSPLLSRIGMGFNNTMLGTFRILCVGYGLYAIANSIMLIQLYFSDNEGAFWSSTGFFISASIGTLLLINSDFRFYGFGFVLGGAVMYCISWIRLASYIKKIQYHILCAQPVLAAKQEGFFTKISEKFQRKFEDKNLKSDIVEDSNFEETENVQM